MQKVSKKVLSYMLVFVLIFSSTPFVVFGAHTISIESITSTREQRNLALHSSTHAYNLTPASGRIPFENRYYQLFDNGLTWEQARAYAQSIGGDLAVIRNQATQDFIYNTLIRYGSRPYYWIGGYRIANTGANQFAWVAGEPMAFTNWATGEPNNAGGIEDRIEFRRNGYWNDIENNPIDWRRIRMGFIVEFSSTGPPAEQTSSVTTTDTIVVSIDNTHFRPATARWGEGIRRQLIRNPDGTILDLNAGHTSFTAQLHAHDGRVIFTREIPFELPLFGAFFSGANYNFAVFGQNNMDERTDVEVFRFVRYDKEWNRIDDLRLFGGADGQFGHHDYGNVAQPFRVGGPRFAEYGDTLVLHTGRSMYHCMCETQGGTRHNHQRSLYIFVNIPTMSFIPTAGLPWFSHSYNQFPIFDNGQPVFLDHGSAFPRTIGVNRGRTFATEYHYIIRYDDTRQNLGYYDWDVFNYIYRYNYFIRPNGARQRLSISSWGASYYWDGNDFNFIPDANVRTAELDIRFDEVARKRFDYGIMLEIPGAIGDNFTGISIGGFEVSSHNFIASANIAPGFSSANDRQRDIYTLVIPRNFVHYDTGTQNRIATFSGTNKFASIPVMLKIAQDRFAMMWEEYDLESRRSQGFVLQHINDSGEAAEQPLRFNSMYAMLAEVLMAEWLIPTEPTRTLRFAIDSTTFTDNGANRTLEAAPFIAYDRTMVPLRVIGEALGATDLAHNAGVITFNIGSQAFTMTVGQQLPGNMGIPVIIAGRTFVPLAFIVDEMGATARWDRDARAAYIYIG